MNTEIIAVFDIDRNFYGPMRAAQIIRRGGLVVLPTETVYGIAANALNPSAVAGIFEAKGRPQDNPLIVHISDYDEIAPLVKSFPDNAKSLAEKFWPGPLTMILPKSEAVPDIVSANLPTVAIRMPSHPVMRAVIKECGLPLAAPSANISGRPSPTRAKHCIDELYGKVDLIIDGGDCDIGLESTVITLVQNPPRLLRPGAVTLEQLREVLGEVEADVAVESKADRDAPALSPGTKYKHYAPNAEITLVHGDFEKFARYAGNCPGAFALVFDGEEKLLDMPCLTYGAVDNPAEQARRLFSSLRELDESGAVKVFARAPDKSGAGLAVYNRLLRAAAFNEIFL